MPVCHKRKLAFCHIPRTGGVSVSTALKMVINDRHYPASWYRKTYPSYKLFTIIRDYEERIKSAYAYRPRNGLTFEALVAGALQRGINNVGIMLKPDEYFLDVPVDFTIRFEYLQKDLDSMLTFYGFDTVELIPCNSFR